MGGVTDLPSSVDVFNYTMHHTKRGVNLFEPTEGRVEVATEVRPNRSSLRCPLPVSETYALHKLPSSTLKTNGAAWQVRDDVPQRCIEAARENSTADAVLPFPVVGSGSVVRVRNRVYALGACNTIPPEVSLDLLRATENRKGGVRGARAASSANSAAPSPQVRLVEDYLRSVTRLQLYANANASVLHQHVIYQPPSMTLRFNATCVAGPRGTVYIVGGTHARTGESLASVAQFDTATETFVEGVWSLDTPVVSPAAASDSGLVFFAGGFSAHDTPTFFDPSRQRRD
ncbi:putative protein kinase [Leptomonas pyrrhocoris]|uniref:Uncharacterized protein n=1 Tax=Leptomonas pyrrhocoris TaxID=157538 RepID=A0A0M9FRR4_LEPPY|nr:putative protein kinase [Leptomonas pyrrhocoris]KPA74715.1 putative protein kinase [Leptomonas pyrrhocoris]|eukprot:XP_015653154.1 putative protein kinase [Leptomonas pyrrhocoris]